MARRSLFWSLVAAATLGSCADDQGPVAPRPVEVESHAVSASPERPQRVPDQYIVVFKDDAPNPRILSGQIAAQHGLTIRHTYEHTIKGFSAIIPEPALKGLANHPWIASIEPNRVAYLYYASSPDPVPTEGLRMRLVADELSGSLAEGSAVSSWPNLGSDGNAVQGSSSRRPTFHGGSGGLFGGHAHVGFNEGSDNDEYLEVTGIDDHGSATLIAVFSQDDAHTHHYGILGLYGNSKDRTSFVTRRNKSGSDPLAYWDQTNKWKQSGFVVSAGTPHVAVWRIEGGLSADFQVDGTAQGSAAMGSSIRQPYDRYIVGWSGYSGERFDGQVAELLLYDRPLSNCERDNIVAKLGTRYGIAVAAGGEGCVLPAAPTDLAANAADAHRIDLSWIDNAVDETGYRIERREGQTGTFAEVASVGAGVTSHADTGLPAETEYCYRVMAFNGNGDSDFSNVACATTSAAPPPPPPDPVPTAGLRVRLVADDLVALLPDGADVAAWPNLGSDGDAAQGNAVQRPTFHAWTGDRFGGRAHVGFNESTDNDELLEITGVAGHGSATLIAVFSQDDEFGHHYGLFSLYGNSTDRTSFVTRRYTGGANPLAYWDRTNGWKESGFTVSAGTPHVAVWRIEGGLTADFQVDGMAQGGVEMGAAIHQPFDRYIVGTSNPGTEERFDGQLAELLLYDRPLSDCQRDDIVAKLGSRYGIAVAVSGGACLPPGAPTDLTAAAFDAHRIDLSWTDNAVDESGYRIERSEGSSGTFVEVATVGSGVTSHEDPGLTAETEYCYRVAAFNGNGDSVFSNVGCATTPAGAPPPPPDPVPAAGLGVRLVADELGALLPDGSDVAAWPNLGSDGDAAQASGTQRPAFHDGSGDLFAGHAHVGFNESTDNDELLEITGVAGHGAATLIAVFSQDDEFGHHYGLMSLYGDATDRVSFVTRRYTGGTNPLAYWDRTHGWKESGFTVSAGIPHVAVWRVNASESVDFQVDGTGQGSVPISGPAHQPFDRYLIGTTLPSGDERFDGQIAEILLYDRALSSCERDDIVAKLGARYGIAVAVTGGGLCEPPADPTDLTATAVDYARIDLAWSDNASNEEGYRIERREGQSGAFVEIATVGAGIASYVDDDAALIPEAEYCYRVTGFNGDGDSGASNTACATPPAAPPGVCANTGGHDDLTGLWNITKVRADHNRVWLANQRPGCEITPWFFGLDSGVDSDHPDLNVVEVRNFVAAEPQATGEDGNGHGTHTAGTAAAKDGNGGVVGVAPGAPIYGFRVCQDDGSCTYDDIIAAVDEVTGRKLANPAQPIVANLSLGGEASDAMDTALRRSVNAGVVYAIAAGNGVFGGCFFPNDAQNVSPARSGDDDINAANGSNGNTRRINGALTTTSSNANDQSVGCNYGNPVTIASPGVNVKSTWLNGGTNTISGTSMATPHTAGAAILHLQEHPAATPTQIEQAIRDRLDPWSGSPTPNADGRLNVKDL